MQNNKLKWPWDYSRNRKMHWIDDGDFYKEHYLFEIKDCRPMGYVHKPFHGYDLYHKGKYIRHARTVIELKQLADAL